MLINFSRIRQRWCRQLPTNRRMSINQRIWRVQNWHLGVWILDGKGLQVSMFPNGHGMDAEVTLVKRSKPNNLELLYFDLVGYTSVRNIYRFCVKLSTGSLRTQA